MTEEDEEEEPYHGPMTISASNLTIKGVDQAAKTVAT